ncbi:hypothetical protein R3P38DRAFT_2772347 [Favolaschia claudopus]|uniref:Uncharacterized protein n=1 Tax=Favolaschia claudopus TaxID=2862362 RepID=A0AAW0C5F2_9AGAR
MNISRGEHRRPSRSRTKQEQNTSKGNKGYGGEVEEEESRSRCRGIDFTLIGRVARGVIVECASSINPRAQTRISSEWPTPDRSLGPSMQNQNKSASIKGEEQHQVEEDRTRGEWQTPDRSLGSPMRQGGWGAPLVALQSSPPSAHRRAASLPFVTLTGWVGGWGKTGMRVRETKKINEGKAGREDGGQGRSWYHRFFVLRVPPNVDGGLHKRRGEGEQAVCRGSPRTTEVVTCTSAFRRSEREWRSA